MELGIQSFENSTLRLHEVSASKGQYAHQLSEHLLGEPGEDNGLYKHKYSANSCGLPF